MYASVPRFAAPTLSCFLRETAKEEDSKEDEYIAPILFLSDRVESSPSPKKCVQPEQEKPGHLMTRIELANLEAWESFGGLDLDDVFKKN